MDDHELADLDPFDALDREAARIDAHLSSLPEAGWTRPSRCAGWSTRDVVAHLVAAERYHHACLDGTVEAFLREQRDRGGVDLAAANALDIARLADRSPVQLIAAWRDANADTRRRFRERDDGVVDTSIGEYPNRWQAFHVAGELATHADDMSAPVLADERVERMTWRAAYSRFALTEEKPDLVIEGQVGRTRVRGQGIDITLDDDELVEAVAGRLDDSSRLDQPTRAVLDIMP